MSEQSQNTLSPYVNLAKQSLEAYINHKEIMSIPKELPIEMLTLRAGTFVSIKKQGNLRGCIGTLSPTLNNIAEEIIHNAICSGTRDPRFNPVESHELPELVYSVDVLKTPETISSMQELDIHKYGVIVKSGVRLGLLLPNLEGVDSPQQQVEIALSKAGISEDEEYKMERFEVIRYSSANI